MILFLSVAMLLAGCDKDNAPVAVSEVTLSRTALTMTVGDTEKLTATVLPEHAGYDGLVWSSNNTSVALVDVEGLVTAVSAGNATITATVGGKQVTCEVTVADAVPEGLTVTTFYLAKGLEFDQVFSIFPSKDQRPLVRQARYIAATRALHELYAYEIQD